MNPARRREMVDREHPSLPIVGQCALHLRLVAVLTVRTKDLASSVRSSAASALSVSGWDTSAPFCEYLTFTGAHATFLLSGFLTPRSVPFSLTVYT